MDLWQRQEVATNEDKLFFESKVAHNDKTNKKIKNKFFLEENGIKKVKQDDLLTYLVI